MVLTVLFLRFSKYTLEILKQTKKTNMVTANDDLWTSDTGVVLSKEHLVLSLNICHYASRKACSLTEEHQLLPGRSWKQRVCRFSPRDVDTCCLPVLQNKQNPSGWHLSHSIQPLQLESLGNPFSGLSSSLK